MLLPSIEDLHLTVVVEVVEIIRLIPFQSSLIGVHLRVVELSLLFVHVLIFIQIVLVQRRSSGQDFSRDCGVLGGELHLLLMISELVYVF